MNLFERERLWRAGGREKRDCEKDRYNVELDRGQREVQEREG